MKDKKWICNAFSKTGSRKTSRNALGKIKKTQQTKRKDVVGFDSRTADLEEWKLNQGKVYRGMVYLCVPGAKKMKIEII